MCEQERGWKHVMKGCGRGAEGRWEEMILGKDGEREEMVNRIKSVQRGRGWMRVWWSGRESERRGVGVRERERMRAGEKEEKERE